MDCIFLTAGKDDSGRRLDRIARRVFPREPLSRIYEHIRKGFIRVNGKISRPDARVREGDCIGYAAFLTRTSAEREFAPRFACAEIDILFENEHLVIINKPRGIFSHLTVRRADIGAKAFCVSEWIKLRRETARESLSFVPAPLHRLDKDTTGILVCSQDLAGARWFSEALRNRLIRKTYLAVVEGNFHGSQIWRDTMQESGRAAVTLAKSLAAGVAGGRAVSLAEFEIETGRKHQIRKQSAARGFPLLGDTRYGEDSATCGYFLHAREMAFPADNPLGVPRVIAAPLPDDFQQFLSCAGIVSCELARAKD
ncbi:MAG: RluA family pseudouridine synthase [Treponemataceae bacterium]|nr:MAG: RluA family pseudouridine synthase [Treponemataceae bacterium]